MDAVLVTTTFLLFLQTICYCKSSVISRDNPSKKGLVVTNYYVPIPSKQLLDRVFKKEKRGFQECAEVLTIKQCKGLTELTLEVGMPELSVMDAIADAKLQGASLQKDIYNKALRYLELRMACDLLITEHMCLKILRAAFAKKIPYYEVDDLLQLLVGQGIEDKDVLTENLMKFIETERVKQDNLFRENVLHEDSLIKSGEKKQSHHHHHGSHENEGHDEHHHENHEGHEEHHHENHEGHEEHHHENHEGHEEHDHENHGGHEEHDHENHERHKEHHHENHEHHKDHHHENHEGHKEDHHENHEGHEEHHHENHEGHEKHHHENHEGHGEHDHENHEGHEEHDHENHEGHKEHHHENHEHHKVHYHENHEGHEEHHHENHEGHEEHHHENHEGHKEHHHENHKGHEEHHHENHEHHKDHHHENHLGHEEDNHENHEGHEEHHHEDHEGHKEHHHESNEHHKEHHHKNHLGHEEHHHENHEGHVEHHHENHEGHEEHHHENHEGKEKHHHENHEGRGHDHHHENHEEHHDDELKALEDFLNRDDQRSGEAKSKSGDATNIDDFEDSDRSVNEQHRTDTHLIKPKRQIGDHYRLRNSHLQNPEDSKTFSDQKPDQIKATIFDFRKRQIWNRNRWLQLTDDDSISSNQAKKNSDYAVVNSDEIDANLREKKSLGPAVWTRGRFGDSLVRSINNILIDSHGKDQKRSVG